MIGPHVSSGNPYGGGVRADQQTVELPAFVEEPGLLRR
jgi:hypothetical protein